VRTTPSLLAIGCLTIAVVDAPAAIAVGGRVLARVRLPATAG
jgi:hypothetical protein